jgi:hypothetical protein
VQVKALGQRQAYCRACQRDMRRAYYQANKARYLRRQRVKRESIRLFLEESKGVLDRQGG